MTKQEKKLNSIQTAVYKNFGINGSREHFTGDLQAIKFGDLEPEIFWGLLSYLRSKKGINLNHNHYCYCIRVFEEEAKQTAEEKGKMCEKLVAGFWQEMHNNGREAANNYYKKHIEEYKYFGLA